jgi:hypothetical protein
MLKNVYASNEDNGKQLEMLKSLRESLNISEDVHNKLEAEIKQELMNAPLAKPVDNIMGDDMHLLIEQPKAAESVQSIPAAPKTLAPVVQPPAPSKALTNVKYKKYLTLGKQKYRKKDYESALKYYLKAQDVLPEDEEVKFLIKKVNLKIHTIKKGEKKVESGKPDALDASKIDEEGSAKMELTSISPPTALPVNEPSSVELGIDTHAPSAIPVSEAKEPKTEKKLGMIDDDSECISCETTGKCFWCNGSGDCDRCGGSGNYGDQTCSMCNGTGKCNSCSGSGDCPWCDGTGSRASKKSFFK